MKRTLLLMAVAGLLLQACTPTDTTLSEYFDNTGRDDVLTGGIKMIPISTPKGTFKVWTKRVGNNPDIKVLILHGGPGATHEAYVPFDSYFPREGFEYYYYDQLGSHYSDQPADTSLWDTERFVEEVEQVRQALGLSRDNFFLYGQSWGGILAIEYALEYQDNLKGLIISNMMASIPAYNEYAANVLAPQLDPDVLAELQGFEERGEFDDERYLDLLLNQYYTEHVLRMPVAEWPEAVNRTFAHLNPEVYVLMQGPSEFGASGKLEFWDRTGDLPRIAVATLTIGARYDTMDPEHMEWMSTQVQRGRFLFSPNGSHFAQYDDQEVYFDGLIRFITDVASGAFE